VARPISTITRMLMGDFVGGAADIAGRVVVTAFLVRHPDATILVDTGFARDLWPEDVAELGVWQRDVVHVLGEQNIAPSDIDLVIDCHLHADHAGGNRDFPGIPIHVQPAEVEAAREPDYTVAAAVDLDGLDYRLTAGEHEPLPGVRVIPTPGHTPGHQSVAVDTAEGLVVLGGQSFRWASQYGMALRAMERRLDGDPDAPLFPDWLPRIVELDPWRVIFAHDYAIWQKDG
jgi:N-acyl homoserine lactone hydrolase